MTVQVRKGEPNHTGTMEMEEEGREREEEGAGRRKRIYISGLERWLSS